MRIDQGGTKLKILCDGGGQWSESSAHPTRLTARPEPTHVLRMRTRPRGGCSREAKIASRSNLEKSGRTKLKERKYRSIDDDGKNRIQRLSHTRTHGVGTEKALHPKDRSTLMRNPWEGKRIGGHAPQRGVFPATSGINGVERHKGVRNSGALSTFLHHPEIFPEGSGKSHPKRGGGRKGTAATIKGKREQRKASFSDFQGLAVGDLTTGGKRKGIPMQSLHRTSGPQKRLHVMC